MDSSLVFENVSRLGDLTISQKIQLVLVLEAGPALELVIGSDQPLL